MSFSSPQRGQSAAFLTPEGVGSSTRPSLSEPSLTATKKRLLDVLPKEIDDIHVDGTYSLIYSLTYLLTHSLTETKKQRVRNVDEMQIKGDCSTMKDDANSSESGFCLEIINQDGVRQGYNRLNKEWLISELLAHIMPKDKLSSSELYDQKNKVVRRESLVSILDQNITYRIKPSKIAK